MSRRKTLFLFVRLIVFILLTIITQIGGIVLLLSLIVCKKLDIKRIWSRWAIMLGLYLLMTYTVVPGLAGMFGRERAVITEGIKPANYMTVLLNRNYIKPLLNDILLKSEEELKGTGIEIQYLDGNFPFLDGFPLLPHLSHKDGKKLDISLIYKNEQGVITNNKPSLSGYGVFEEPLEGELNQTERCKSMGYFQYDYPKYLTFGKINSSLSYSNSGTKRLTKAILQSRSTGKIFIEPHLRSRLNINDKRIAYHGCQAVRHDDHIHIQLK